MSIKDLFTHDKAKQVKTTKAGSVQKDNLPTKELQSKEKINTPRINYSVSLSHRVLIKPLITEKGAKQTEQGKYFFMVSPKANKIMIKQAMLETYGIRPIQVNIVNLLGKKVRSGRRLGVRKDWKKAIVTLPKGKTIDVYKGV
jgi:large subunit ribosomal protein L23